MGVRVRYSDGSERWCESCADPNDNGGSVVQGGTEHNKGGGTMASPDVQAPNSGPQGPGGNGPNGSMAAAATQSDRTGGYASFYPSTYGANGGPSTGGGSSRPNSTSSGSSGYPAPGPNSGGSPGNNPIFGANNPGGTLGTPKTNQEWSFDPTDPAKAISAGMSLLGLPSYGPAAQFYSQYGQAGISQALADGDFVTPGAFQNAMTNRLQGINPNMDAASMVRALMGGETLANQEANGGNVSSNPTDMARAAYIAKSENDPNGIAQLLTGALTGNGMNMGSSVASLLGAFLGNIGTRRFNAATPQNDTMNYLGKLLGY